MRNTTAARAIDGETARRLLNMLRVWERLPRNEVPQPRGPRRPGAGGPQLYQLTGAIAGAASLTAVTHGNANPMVFDGSAALTADAARTVTLYNFHTKGFTASAVVAAAPGTGGVLWILDVRDCAMLT